MKTLSVHVAPQPYQIFIGRDCFTNTIAQLKKIAKEDRLFILTNTKIKKLYQKRINEVFSTVFKVHWLIIPDGEQFKNLSTCEKILLQLSKKEATRDSLLIAFGGGVVGDIGGFVAATYMRGIGYVQMPTTLLAQVDSSVGGKTGVDLPTGKNLVGAFYQPKAVFIDIDFLNTLPKREFLCGMAEVIKYGVIWDASFFSFLQKNVHKILNLDPRSLAFMINRCLEIKAHVVGEDEKESSLRAILNYGHTLGHAIEALKNFTGIKHGEAVAIGMVYAAKLADTLQYTKTPMQTRLTDLLCQYGLPVKWPKYAKKDYVTVMKRDKKSTKTAIKFIMPIQIGEVKIVPLPVEEILQCL